MLQISDIQINHDILDNEIIAKYVDIVTHFISC
jgi:hypothetical protein